ncbi:hypothetical protein M0R88_00125 [Halorussus gelatinilyticus]|uniref:Uncharacterized protein n=1 Tax=Halorussus gelatinilyticus TaxID=2937524 RepID=A0A8U0IIL3_9EURY|nr:hypothetical protein [Halorussus gelatinilyticus]UPW00526.1 hypothetical protein M0R88_00125 [Halorussus gelatinilyticus]
MANPHKEQRRREASNEDGLHESRETRHESWTELEGDRDDQQRRSGDHPADERHSNDYGNAADRDHERRTGRETGHGSSHDERRQSRSERQKNHDETGHGHANRWGSNRTHGESNRTHGESDQTHGQRDPTGSDRSNRPDSEHYGKENRRRSGRESHDTGSSRTGSQRGSHREEGISGRMTGQRGSSDRHSDPSDSEFRDQTRGEREHRHGGDRGTSERDRRYGSRHGHGSERETERRQSSH